MNQDLPQIQMPGNFPAWLIEGHTATDTARYARSEMSTGHSRLRRVYGQTPQVRNVALYLTQAQGVEFFSWFENDLRAGELRFAAKVRDFAPYHFWYGAIFQSPYQADAISHGRADGIFWKISATLVLYGAGRGFGPLLTSFESAVRVPLVGSARGGTSVLFAAGVSVPLQGVVADVAFSSEVDVALEAEVLPEGTLPFYSDARADLIGSAAAIRTTYFSADVNVHLTGSVS